MTTDLTRDRIMELKAGKSLNQLIAEHVMGWTRIDEYPEDWRRRNPGYSPDNISPWTGKPCAYHGPWWIPPGYTVETSSVNGANWPDWSNDIAAAFEVVEKMREEGFDVSITAPRGLAAGWHSGWDVHFWSEHGRHSENSQSLPECIAKCALLAKLR